MSLLILPKEIHLHIIYSLKPDIITLPELATYKDTLQNLSATNKYFREICSDVLNNPNKIHSYIKEFFAYNHLCDPAAKKYPQLLDALASGPKISSSGTTTYLTNSHSYFTDAQETAIKDIIRFMPQSVNCNLGIYLTSTFKAEGSQITMRWERRCSVPPLAIACINPQINLLIIENLLKEGANPNAIYKIDAGSGLKDIHILADVRMTLERHGMKERFQKIENIFKKYKADPNHVAPLSSPQA